nr:uncharacterized protein LOC111771008 [Equus caballus]XP_023486928.1 uncharacterized protein LOC111771008 [Equus caballus]XP_023486929.1 uncharacterized protein LOC111771008 [Equus caballus]XP_023486930.1 uncharacterized protein LOC111771008 [Equus caballus]
MVHTPPGPPPRRPDPPRGTDTRAARPGGPKPGGARGRGRGEAVAAAARAARTAPQAARGSAHASDQPAGERPPARGAAPVTDSWAGPPPPPARPLGLSIRGGRGWKGPGQGLRPIASGGGVGGCVTDRRQDAGAAAPLGGRGDAGAAERTPALRQRPRRRADRVPVRGTVGRPAAPAGVSPTATGGRDPGLVPATAPVTAP